MNPIEETKYKTHLNIIAKELHDAIRLLDTTYTNNVTSIRRFAGYEKLPSMREKLDRMNQMLYELIYPED